MQATPEKTAPSGAEHARGVRPLTGNEAIARGAWEAGVRVAAAYPGTPSTEIMESLADYPAADLHAQWSTNEKVALDVAIGASFAGRRALASMKHVGLNVAADAFMSQAYIGVNGGLVLAVCDDPGIHSSQNEQDTRIYGQFATVPVLEPSDAQEALDLTRLAFDISEQFDTMVIVRGTTRLSHTRSPVALGRRTEAPSRGFVENPAKNVMIPAHARPRHLAVLEREAKLKRVLRDCADQSLGNGRCGDRRHHRRHLLSLRARSAAQGERAEAGRLLAAARRPAAALLRIGRARVRGRGTRAGDRKGAARARTARSRASSSSRARASSRPRSCAPGSRRPACSSRGRSTTAGRPSRWCGRRCCAPAARTPRASWRCAPRARASPATSAATRWPASIRCAAWIPRSSMGSSIGNAIGMSKAGDTKPVMATIGDSTFLHAGIPRLIDAVYNQANITVLLLDNHITAMTGGQEHPGTGKTLRGEAGAEGRLRGAGARHRREMGAHGGLLRSRRHVPDAARGDRPSRRVGDHLQPSLRARPGEDQGTGARESSTNSATPASRA